MKISLKQLCILAVLVALCFAHVYQTTTQKKESQQNSPIINSEERRYQKPSPTPYSKIKVFATNNNQYVRPTTTGGCSCGRDHSKPIEVSLTKPIIQEKKINSASQKCQKCQNKAQGCTCNKQKDKQIQQKINNPTIIVTNSDNKIQACNHCGKDGCGCKHNQQPSMKSSSIVQKQGKKCQNCQNDKCGNCQNCNHKHSETVHTHQFIKKEPILSVSNLRQH